MSGRGGRWKVLHKKIEQAGETPCPATMRQGTDVVHCQGVKNHRGPHRRGQLFWPRSVMVAGT